MTNIEIKKREVRKYIGKFGINKVGIRKETNELCVFVKNKETFLKTGYDKLIESIINDSRIGLLIKEGNPVYFKGFSI